MTRGEASFVSLFVSVGFFFFLFFSLCAGSSRLTKLSLSLSGLFISLSLLKGSDEVLSGVQVRA